MNIHRFILGSRYFLIPLYVGMTLVGGLLTIKFFQELFQLCMSVTSLNEHDVILGVLALVDLMLVANLLVMVILSGYETFISPLNAMKDDDKPTWLGTLDMGAIKIKVATSLVGISSISLLSAFLNIKQYEYNALLWLVITHLVFLVSALCLAWVDRISLGKD